MNKGKREATGLRDLLDKRLALVNGSPHGSDMCWIARIASFTPLLLILLAVLKWGWWDYWGVAMAVVAGVALVGFQWHLVPAIVQIPGGVLLLAWVLMLSAVMGQSAPGEWVGLCLTLIAGGITNLLAWLAERRR
jgi:hypothetical protein